MRCCRVLVPSIRTYFILRRHNRLCERNLFQSNYFGLPFSGMESMRKNASLGVTCLKLRARSLHRSLVLSIPLDCTKEKVLCHVPFCARLVPGASGKAMVIEICTHSSQRPIPMFCRIFYSMHICRYIRWGLGHDK
jgi:hypothetical protein